MTKSASIKKSYELSKQAAAPPVGAIRSLWNGAKAFGIKAGTGVKNNWMKLPGSVRYGTGIAATAGFPIMTYMGGKAEAEEHIANKAYDDAYNLAQTRIGQEWENLPAWKRYAASTLGLQNSMALKDSLTNTNGGIMYETKDGMGNTTYN